MTLTVQEILKRMYEAPDREKSEYVFWHRYYSRKAGEWVTGPYDDRKKFMRTLCKNAGVPYFRFHSLRHARRSLLEDRMGMSTAYVDMVMGHLDQSTARMYLHQSVMTAHKEASINEVPVNVGTQTGLGNSVVG